MSGQSEDYRNEIINFLRTVSIKFEPFAYQMGEPYMLEHGISNPHGEWNPYYKNLIGEYTENDEVMKVYSVETGSEVVFNRELLVTNPKTASLYKVGTAEFANLEDKYPKNRGLIRSIIYPVKNIQEAIKAPNLSLLAYDASYLESNERESIISCLKQFLHQCRIRWWRPEYLYEDLYAVTFWAIIHQLMPIVLLVQRFNNIKTPAVHSFHIWEFLKSKGLGDYRDILTTRQSLWLYRNIDHINRHKGSSENLLKLADNILGDIAVSLQYKDMYQDNVASWSTLENIPRFKTFNILTDKEAREEDFETLNNRIVAQKLDVPRSLDKVVEEERKLGRHNFNVLPTKYLELKKDTLDSSYAQAMANFFLDTIMYKVSTKKLSYSVKVYDPLSGGRIKLHVHDAILLYYYAVHASLHNKVTVIPNKYVCRYAYQNIKPKFKDLAKERVTLDGRTKTLHELVNLKGLLNSHSWRNTVTSDVTTFATDLAKDYTAYIWSDRWLNSSADFFYHTGMKYYEELTSVKDVLTLDLTTAKTYTEWMSTVPKVQSLITNIDAESLQIELYSVLAQNCWDALFPVTSEMSNLISSPRQMEKIYAATKELFIKLCSYGVTYLDNDRDENKYCKVPDPEFIFNIGKDIEFNGSGIGGLFNIVLDPIKHRAIEDSVTNIPGEELNCDISLTDRTEEWLWRHHLETGPFFSHTRAENMDRIVTTDVDTNLKKTEYFLKFSCDIGF